MRIFSAFLVLSIFSCSQERDRIVIREDPSQKEASTKLDELNNRIKALELFASTFTSGVPSDFNDCSTLTSASEKKICQIAQTISATQSLELKTQLATIAKEFQNTLYGVDCINTTDVGCPVSGSLLERMTTARTDINNNTSSISSINSTITSMQTIETNLTSKVNALETRLNAFNGTAESIETIITGIKSDITTLQTDMAEVKGILTPSRIINQYLICGDVTASGPIYELILISGDKTKAYGSVKNGTFYGPALFFKAGDTDLGFDTHLNTKTCHFKMYNNVAKTKVQACWLSSNRSATNAQIDTARAANTATCTLY